MALARPGLVPQAIVLALGAGALGGPDALRLLLQFAGRGSPAVDVAVCVVVISLLTAAQLGTMLLARFVRKARPGAGGSAAPATELFAQLTATVAVGAAFLVTACLLVVPGGGLGAVRLPVDFAVVTNAIVVTVLPIVVTMLLARSVRKARRAGGGAAAAPATDLFAQLTATVAVGAAFLVTACLLVAPGGGAVRHPIDFVVKNPFAITVIAIPTAVAVAAAATGSLPRAVNLRAHFFRGARNAAGAGGGPAAARTG